MEKRSIAAEDPHGQADAPVRVLTISESDYFLDLRRESIPACAFLNYPNLNQIKVSELDQSVRVLLLDADPFSHQSLATELKALEKGLPNVAVILVSSEINLQLITTVINQGSCFKLLKKDSSYQKLKTAMVEGIRRSEELAQQRRVLKEVSSKNRKLERLTRDLEKIVAERTYHIEISKQEIENKIAKMKQLLRFIKGAGSCENLDELAQLIRREIRRFHKVGDPLISYSSESSGRFILFFHQGNIIERRIREGLSVDLSELEGNSRHYVAGLLERPVAQLLSVNLIDGVGNLFVEHSLSPEEIQDFEQFISQRLQPIRMATERLLISEQVATASYRWEKTFDGIRDPISIVDNEGLLIHSNNAFNAAFGKGFELGGSLAGEDGSPIERAFATGEPQNGTLSHQGQNFEVHSYPISVSRDGRVSNVVNYFTDVTAKRRLYSRMIQNEKMGAIGLLAGNIAHELNNPLTGIRSLVQTLVGEADSAELAQDLREIENAAHRSQKVIKNLLDFSKGQGRVESVGIDEIVTKTLPMLKTALRMHRLFLRLDSANLKVQVEPTLLQQVVFNLVNNACQAMSEPGEVHIESQRSDSRVVLSISDTGTGIPESQIERIFEPFFTTKKEGAGTGLGLSMSKSIISNFGGTIEVKSELGQGTCFSVSLPIEGGGK